MPPVDVKTVTQRPYSTTTNGTATPDNNTKPANMRQPGCRHVNFLSCDASPSTYTAEGSIRGRYPLRSTATMDGGVNTGTSMPDGLFLVST